VVTVKHNKSWWESYDWNESGDEWSQPWGSTEAQWYGSLMPRIHHFLPAGEILEIACGHGRWTQYLKDQCERMTAVDLAENCIAACSERFANEKHLRFATNDGSSLPGVRDASIDFAFSYDSLVHVDTTIIAAYLGELRRVLKPEGVAFIHHSNLGAYRTRYERLRKVPKLPGALRRLHLLEYTHMRDESVTAEFVAEEAERVGLRCVGQELIPWLTSRTWIDCLSVIVPAESSLKRSNRVVRNMQFSAEPAYVARVASVYSPSGSEARS
jgi:ubiquinone/menaquinone biosynthesis C-methylase UbiE